MGINIQHMVRQEMRRDAGGRGGCRGEEKNETDKKRYKVRESASEMETETGRDK